MMRLAVGRLLPQRRVGRIVYLPAQFTSPRPLTWPCRSVLPLLAVDELSLVPDGESAPFAGPGYDRLFLASAC
jgi:hypothetical protein